MKKKKVWIAAGILAAILLVAAGTFGIYFSFGKSRLQERISCVDGMPAYQDDSIIYKENLINILLLGIDKEKKMGEADEDGGSLGQADAIFVVSLDLEKEELNIISIPRDTMVEIRLYSQRGEYAGKRKAQLCLQYAYGDGRAVSCGLMMDQVSKLLGIPLHGYVALNLEMLPILNDAVGGIDITMEEDYSYINPAFVEGAKLHLTGEEARDYLKVRDIEVPESAYYRLDRHKQYIKAFYQQAKTKLADHPLLIFSLLQTVSGYMETDLKANEIASLIQTGKNCAFDEEHMWVLEGNIVQGAVYEEYYVDQEKLEDLMGLLFYDRKTR